MEKYTTTAIINSLADDMAAQKEEEKKIVISNDAYAVSEFLESLFNKIEQLRISLIK